MSDLGKRIANLTPEKRVLFERHLLNKGRASLPTKLEIPRRGTSDPCALSFSQQRLWFLDQLEPGSPAYNIPLAIRLGGRLNVTALQQSIGEILRRHEVLRTTFSTENEQPVQRTTPAAAFSLPEADLSALPEGQREAKAKQLASEEASRPFDLVTGPLLRATLLRLTPEDHVLLLTMHHIISDGWSMGILYRELSVLYKAFSKGDPSPLPELPIQYADFAVWQREWLQGKKLEEQLTFWKEQLGDITTLELPTDHVRPLVQTFHGAMHTVEFPQGLKETLQGLSRKEGVTLFMTLLTAFQSLLHRYTGQDDIVVGTPIANRNREEIEGLIGFFVNTLVMRTDTSGNPVFRELLKQVRNSTLDAYAHQDLPFEKLIKELQPERDLSRNPLFQVMFALQNVPVSTPELSGLMLSRIWVETTRTRFDLEVALSETREGLKCTYVYNTDLFDSATIERMAGHYQKILEGIAANPDQRLSELPLLTEAERHKLLVEWNDTGADYPRDKCIHELFEEQVEKTPDAIAVVFEDQKLTYRELNERANRLAHHLQSLGVGPEVLVGICVERSLEMVIGILGILKAGGAYVPLDPAYPKERLEFMLYDGKVSVLLTQRKLVDQLPEHQAGVVCLDTNWEALSPGSGKNLTKGATADNLCSVMYTSGSTGGPKGVSVLHRGVVRLVKETDYVNLTAEEVFLQLSSISFDASTFEIWGSLLNGARLVVMPPGTPALEELGQAIEQHQVTTLWLTAGLFHLMVDEQLEAFKHVRQLLAGGDVLSVPHVRRFLQKHRNCRLINGYGPTENTTFTSCHAVKEPGRFEHSIPVGRPIANTQVYVLDSYLQPAPVGVPGELHAGGDGLARGYLNQPKLTEEKFIPDPFSKEPGARLYKTGDIVRYLPDGNLEFLGRIDHQVKIRGFRIELGEIESVLAQHPFVAETVVIAREDQRGDKRLVGYVVLKENSAVRNHELRNFLMQKLPDYMMPAAYVVLDSLPLTPNGKVDRRALPAPESERLGAEDSYLAPRTSIEELVAGIWREILGLKRVGIHDNFFDLGGHSLLAVRLAAEINKVTGKKLPVMALFHSPTVGQLAKILTGEACSEQFSSLIPIRPNGTRLPFFWVHGQESGAKLPRYLDPDQPIYGLLHQREDWKVLYTTVEEIAAHYLKEMRVVQPKGPYSLGGFCFGAMVALEMAQRLLKLGEEVRLLFLLDPPKNCFPLTRQDNASLPKNSSFQSRVVSHGRNLALLPLGESIAYMFQKLLNAFTFVRERMRIRGRRKIKMAICKVCLYFRLPLPVSLLSFYHLEFYRKVIPNYIPEVYTGRAVLCHSDRISYGPSESCLTAGGVKVHTIDGVDHSRIIQKPHIGSWARQLNIYLNEMQEKKGDTQS